MRTPWEVLADLERDAMRGLSVQAWSDLAHLNGRCDRCGALRHQRMRHKPWCPA